MVWRVVREYLWLHRWGLGLSSLVMAQLWLAGHILAQAEVRVAVAAVASGMAWLFAGSLVPRREVTQLPLSRRQLWLVLACATTLLPAVLTFVLAGLTGGVARDTGLFGEAAWIAALWSFLLGGAVLGLTAAGRALVLRRPWNAIRKDGVVPGLPVVALAVIGVLVYLLIDRIPMTVGALSSVSGASLSGAAGVLTLLGLLYRPGPGLPVIGVARAAGPPFPGARRSRLFDDPFGGLLKLAVREARASIFILGLAVIGMFTLFKVIALFWPDFGDDIAVRLPFGGDPKGLVPILMLPVMFAASRDGERGLFSTNQVCAAVRHLRALPVRTETIAAALVTRRAVPWAGFWLASLVVQLVYVGAPAAWRLDWLMAAIAIDASLDALRFKFGAAAAAFTIAFRFAAYMGVVIAITLASTASWLAFGVLLIIATLGVLFAYTTQLENVRLGQGLYQEEAADTPLWSFK